MSRKLLSLFVAVYRRGREERRETNKKWKLFTLFSVYPVKTLRSQRSLRWAELLSILLAALLLFAPSISFATEVMTRCYSKTIGALDSYAKLLIHGDSIGDATGKTVTANGNAAVTTAQYKFAEVGRSIVFDGTGDYLSLADSDDWNFGSGDFTIDFWANFSVLDVSYDMFYSQHINDSSNGYIQFYRGPDNTIYLNARNNTPTTMVASYQTTTPPSLSINTWYHFALVRNGTNISIYLNGVALPLTVNTAIGNNSFPDINVDLTIAANDPTQVANTFSGHLDEFRISKGIARWTSDFTPPTAPYDGARTVINITGLDGNTDEEYQLICRFVNGYGSGANNYMLRPNNDSGSNYGYQQIHGGDTTIGALRATDDNWRLGYSSSLSNISQASAIIYAKSGYARTILNDYLQDVTGTTVTYLVSRGQSWNNTADNITSLVVLASQTNGLGVGTNIELYKKSAK